MPPLLAAVPFLGKAIAGAKGLVGLGAAKGAATQLAIPGLTVAAKGAGSRMAGGKLAGLGKTMLGRLGPIGFGSKEAVTNTALMFGPDLAFGAMAGAMTPGDLGDKIIAGGMTGISGAVGGAGARSLYGGKNAAVQMGLELGGGLGGDMVGQGVADGLLRIKGGGTTPYEKMAAEQQRELEQRILSQYLSGKGGYPTRDPMLAANGLG
jgi:hypothetical protein